MAQAKNRMGNVGAKSAFQKFFRLHPARCWHHHEARFVGIGGPGHSLQLEPVARVEAF